MTLSRSSSGVSRGTPTSTTETPTGKKKGHRSHVSLIGSIFRRGSSPGHDKSRPESLQSKRGREKNSTKRNGFISYHVAKVGEVFRIEEDHKEAGDGWQEFRKGSWLTPQVRNCLLTRKKRHIHVPNLFRDSVTLAGDFEL